MRRDWQKVIDFIATRDEFIVTSHVSPDGDAIGSEVGLAAVLSLRGKRSSIVNVSPTPGHYRFLDPDGTIAQYDPSQHLELFRRAGGVFILDISDWARLREVGKVIKEFDLPRVCIDHHKQTDSMAEVEVIDSSASCTGELIFDLCRAMGVTPQGRLAESLYTCLLTDTGSFRFANTTPEVHRIVAQLVEAGVDIGRVYEQVYESSSPAKVRLMGEVLRSLSFECEGALAWFALTRQALEQSGVKTWELENFPELPRMVAGVEVSLSLTELNNGRTKISLRSKGRIPVIGIATALGGGGHTFAAGAVVPGTIDEVLEKVLGEARRAVETYRQQRAE
ncbi:MAG: bifunctional oligoribonuclease/PAP phosphatase NrnA [candidate division KSB1 bacterium]|nr:bifunctional oligoribonuclease/PAP phosphatase NrnA [candidate division KSB1 bacterium]MDZ7295298.1 bifunctional oligoribonuclease/PAP phosphatase NrnA [candidate division KSB1 bacterium]MDZ7386600.1 bifunctional oligoribonuclease/PAP phosphatase NrnA [candidate division KSB1 bacterium]